MYIFLNRLLVLSYIIYFFYRSEKEKFIIDKYVRKMFIVSKEDESNDAVDLVRI
jgi:hypothetical protein